MSITQGVGYPHNLTAFSLMAMETPAIYENLPTLPVVSPIATPLLQDVAQNSTPKVQESSLDIQHTIQLILDYIIKFHTYNQFVDHTNIWEIDEDTYLIRLGEPHLYLAKFTLHQALMVSSKQILSTTILANQVADQNKELFRLGQILAKYPDLSPCIFQVRLTESYRGSSSIAAVHSQIQILKFLLEHAPLLPKSTKQQIKSDYEALCGKNVDKYFNNNIMRLRYIYHVIRFSFLILKTCD